MDATSVDDPLAPSSHPRGAVYVTDEKLKLIEARYNGVLVVSVNVM